MLQRATDAVSAATAKILLLQWYVQLLQKAWPYCTPDIMPQLAPSLKLLPSCAAAAAVMLLNSKAASSVGVPPAYQQTPVIGSHCSVCGLQLLTAPHAT
jgi:hypothetical protein